MQHLSCEQSVVGMYRYVLCTRALDTGDDLDAMEFMAGAGRVVYAQGCYIEGELVYHTAGEHYRGVVDVEFAYHDASQIATELPTTGESPCPPPPG